MQKSFIFFLIALAGLQLRAQLYTGSSPQFSGYSGGISIGRPLPGFASNINLYVERDTAGTAVFVGNGHTGTGATALSTLSNEGKSLEALTLTGYAVHGTALNAAGYAGYFNGNTFAERLEVGSELGAPFVVAGDFTRRATGLSVRASGAFPHDIAHFQAGSNRLLVVGKAQSQGYNPLTAAGDLGLFFTDGQGTGTSNLAGGFTLAPWRGGNPGPGGGYGLRIDAEGRLGIGIQSPRQALDVRGSIRASGKLELHGELAGDSITYDLAGPGLTFGVKTFANHQSQTQLRARLTPQGWLGLGAANPISPLEVRFDGATAGTHAAISLVATDPANEKSQISFRTPHGEKMSLGTDPDGNGEYAFFVFNGQLGNRAITVKAADNTVNIRGPLLIGEKVTNAGSVSYQDMLQIDGTMACKGARVTMNGWHDYVFAPDYNLPALTEVAAFIGREGHLPGIPSEEEVLRDGVDLGEMQGLLLKKIEELTLYVIELEEKIEHLQSSPQPSKP